jgi:hypothetical protein
VDHEIGHCHLTAADECGQPREQAKGNQKSADKLNPATDLHHGLI